MWPARSNGVEAGDVRRRTSVSRSPSAQQASPMSAVPAPSARRSSSSTQARAPARVDDGGFAVAQRQCQPGAVDRHPGRQPAELLLVDHDHALGRGLGLPGHRPRPSARRPAAAPRPRRPPRCPASSRRTRCRAPAGPGPRRPAAPRARHAAGLLAVPPDHRQAPAPPGRRPARRPLRPCACRIASAGSPLSAYHRLARRCSSGHQLGRLVQQPRLQDVGEEVVVAVPPALVVQRDQEQVAALQRLQHRPAAGLRR